MTYSFVRLQPDGRMASMTPIKQYGTLAAAKAAAPSTLLRSKGGGRIVIVQIIEAVTVQAQVAYEKWPLT